MVRIQRNLFKPIGSVMKKIWGHSLSPETFHDSTSFALALGLPQRMALTSSQKPELNLRYLSISQHHTSFDREQIAWRELKKLSSALDDDDILLSFDEDEEDSIYLMSDIDQGDLKKSCRAEALHKLAYTFSMLDVNEYVPFSASENIAFYSSLIVELSRLYSDINVIEEDEAWGLLFINAERTRVIFDDWESYVGCWKGFVCEELQEVIDLRFTDNLKRAEAKKKKAHIESLAKKLMSIPVVWPESDIFAELYSTENPWIYSHRRSSV